MRVAGQSTISPYTQELYCRIALALQEDVSETVSKSQNAHTSWRDVSIDARIAICTRWLDILGHQIPDITQDLALQMGRPIMYTGEVKGVITRSEHLISIAKERLSPQLIEESESVRKQIVRQPVGVVAIISPWNYPFSCTVNILLPAILAGNAVIIKPSPQTPEPAERIMNTLFEAGLPKYVVQVVHTDQKTTLEGLVADPRVNYVAFTGSVVGGKAVAQAAAGGDGFKGVSLELGGKDAAYVRSDADLAKTVPALVDAMFNCGQSCASVERIYVEKSIYDDFVDQFVGIARTFRLGDPLAQETSLGPVVSLASAARIRKQVEEAVAAGARVLLGDKDFEEAKIGTTTIAPHVVVDVDHSMSIMKVETFGPLVGIMKVDGDEEALQFMNDSDYGLTASVWTSPENADSLSAFDRLSQRLEVGTVYLNKADGMDAALPWGGVKDSGWGLSLSGLAFDQVTRAKAISQRLAL